MWDTTCEMKNRSEATDVCLGECREILGQNMLSNEDIFKENRSHKETYTYNQNEREQTFQGQRW